MPVSGADDVLEQESLTLDLDELGALGSTHLDRLFERIRRGSGHDFSGYKRSSIGRRVARRMAALELPGLDGYLAHLDADPDEVDALVRELLISVTSFFRDPAALSALVDALPPVSDGEAERVWVPGCATGEEAYSIAMLILERGDRALQLFASDIDVAALGRARAGHYPAGIAAQVAPARLARFFSADDRGYAVNPALREPCLFSLHNLLHDPPFARLGLVSCRNLLIYLEPALQQQLMQLFHFALRPGGLLLLGSAENVGSESPLFEPVDHHHRLYRRRELTARPPMWWLGRARRPRPGPAPASLPSAPTVTVRALERALLDEHAPPGAVVTPAGEVVYLAGRGRPFLEPPRGSAPFDLFAMVRPPLDHALRAVLAEAVATHAEATTADVVVAGDAGASAVRISVRPMVEVDPGANLFLVVFRELTMASGAPAGPPPTPSGASGAGDRELITLRGQWHATLRQLEIANDRLRTSSDATVALNEELQSSQEELQSANEELRAVNADLQDKVEALDAAHADLQHLFEATHLATILVGPDLRIRRYSPAATELFRVIPSDVGRPLTDLASRLGPFAIADRVAEVLAHGHQVEARVRRDDDARFLLRVSPFRKLRGEVDGVAVTFIDVTEVDRAREDARARADELEAVVEAMPAAVYVAHDPGATRVTGNREAMRWLSFPRGDDLPRYGGGHGSPIRMRHAGVDLTRDQLAISRAARGESVRGFAIEAILPGDEIRHLYGNAEPLRAADGRPRGAVAAFVDVTALRQAERDLRDSEARYRALAASAVDYISRFDRDLRLVYANPAVLRNVGRPLEELVGRPAAEVSATPGWDDRLREVLDSGEPRRFDWRGAGDRWFDVQLSPEREGDAVVAVIVVARDITAQKQAEQALRVSEARYGAIVASVPVSVAMVRLRDGAFLAVNAEFERLFGYRADEVIGHSALGLGLATPEAQAELAAVIAAGGPLRHFECERRTRAGQPLLVALSSEIVEIDGERIAITSAIDITARRAAEVDKARLQAELAQAQKMEAIGTLAGGVAHDFNNILGGILGGLSLLELPAAAKAELDEITALVTRGADLTRQLLGFARRGKYDVKAVHLTRVLAGLTAMFGRTRRDIAITTELAADLPPVLMDHAQLEQVLLNLFVNAGHAMPDGGDLTVRARPAIDDPERFVLVEIGDTGVGMDAATQARIFEPFFTTRDAGQGTGLGLASVYGIVTHHGGAITVESQLGRGTTFTLRLPAAEAVTPEVVAPTVIAAGEGTILIVDDEPQMLRVCRRMLERAGYDVLSADSGRAAIDMVDRHGASLALCVLDMTMPGLNGARTFEEIRRLQPGLKVLLASGFGVERQAHDLLARGGVAFLQKPFTASQLTGKVREVLASGPVDEVG